MRISKHPSVTYNTTAKLTVLRQFGLHLKQHPSKAGRRIQINPVLSFQTLMIALYGHIQH